MEHNERLEHLRAYIGKEFDPAVTPSALTQWLKPMVVSAEPGSLAFEYEVRADMLNPVGTLHGGVTAAMMDDALGATAYTLNDVGYFHPTVNLSVDYFASARLGDTIIVQTGIIKRGKQIVNMQCEIWNADRSRLLARGTSNLMRVALGVA